MYDKNAPTEIDYEKEGLIVGLEFHQQLLAPYFGAESPRELKKHGSKLFCPCAAVIREDDPDFTVERQLRAVSGETGKVDIAASFEKLKKARTIYEGYNDTTCLVELDEEPILPINREALFRATAIATKLFNLSVFDEILVCRKTIVDGSNTSGFQRTAQIAFGTEESWIDVDGKKVTIYQANLEEDSCKNTGRKGLTRSFRMDRLGIPLIEIATGPDMHSPEEVKKTALRIGTLLRTTGFVKRGLGTIRQDINVSIRDGTRIEIKGVQELDLLPEYVKNEAIRQRRMLQFLEVWKGRGITSDLVDTISHKDVSKILKKTEAKFVAKALKSGGSVIGARLPLMSGLLGFELEPNYRVGTELSEVCKVTSGAGGILHSDELPKFGISQEEVDKVRKMLKCEEDDGFFLIVGPKHIGELSVENTKRIFKIWLESDPLPPEVRAPRPDGTSGFLRPLPGKARMYPETDSPPLVLDEDILHRLETLEIELPEDRLEKYVKKYKLPKDLAEQLKNHPSNLLFEEIVETHKVPATLVATTILSTIVDIRRKGGNTDFITDELLNLAFEKIGSGELPTSAIEGILSGVANAKKAMDEHEALDRFSTKMMSEDEVMAVVEKIGEQFADVITQKQMGAMGTIMGKVMAEIQGAAEGKVVSSMVRKYIQSKL